jgi:hypothetical protein
MAAGIGLTVSTPPADDKAIEGLPAQMEQLAITQQRREMVAMVAESGPRHKGANVAGAIGGHPGTVVSSRGFRQDKFEIVHTKPKGTDKQGKHGDLVPLLSNYFALKKECDWCLYTHSVTFSDDIDSVGLRRKIIKDSKEKVGCFLYDGTVLYSNKELTLDLSFADALAKPPRMITAAIRCVNKLIPGDSVSFNSAPTINLKTLYDH